MPSEAFEPLPDEAPEPANDAGLPPQESGVFLQTAPCDALVLIEFPCRALEVEYKSWRNLHHPEDRAELARDIAALANHGGGHIIYGFDQETLQPEDTHPFWTNCTSEQVAEIVRAYLDPPVCCEVLSLCSSAGNRHPVIRVPGHGAVPICVRQDGPFVGASRLIERGAYYLRRHGVAARGRYLGVPRPESGRIETPQEWAPLIRRCVRQDRETLLAMIEASIESRRPVPSLGERLAKWHCAAHSAFVALLPLSPVADNLRGRHYALSYGLDLIRPEALEQAQLGELLRRVVFELQPTFRGVLNMFDPPYRRAVKARFVVDEAADEGAADFLEAAWLRDRPPSETADFWRVSPQGLATIVRDYAEDKTTANTGLGRRPGTWFSPNALAQEVAELIWHARAMARFFRGVRGVSFRCEWWGLSGRELFDPQASWGYRRPALDDHRLVALQVPVASLTQAWPDLVARIMAPVLRSFEPDLMLGADWVRGQAARWGRNDEGLPFA